MAKIRVGVIGAGANTRLHHIPKLQIIEGVEVVTVANRSLQSAKAVADEFHIPQVASNWKEVIEDKSLDAIVIGTWPYLHHQITLAALRAGKHVLTEARMAMNAQQAREMLKESQANPQLVTQIVPSPSSFPFDTTISNILKAGSLGRLVYIEVRAIGGKFAESLGSALHWRHDVELSGLNIANLGIVYEMLQRWVGDVSSVQALGKTVVGLRKDTGSGELRAVHVPDHLDVLATHPSGAHVHFLVSTVLGGASGFRTGYVLYGTEGTLTLDLDSNKLSLALKEDGASTSPDIAKEVHIPEENKNGWRVEEEFIGAIRGQEQVRFTSFAKGVRYMEFIEAVTRSIQSGSTVKLPLVP